MFTHEVIPSSHPKDLVKYEYLGEELIVYYLEQASELQFILKDKYGHIYPYNSTQITGIGAHQFSLDEWTAFFSDTRARWSHVNGDHLDLKIQGRIRGSGFWTAFGGTLTVIGGVAVIVFTGGAATPVIIGSVVAGGGLGAVCTGVTRSEDKFDRTLAINVILGGVVGGFGGWSLMALGLVGGKRKDNDYDLEAIKRELDGKSDDELKGMLSSMAEASNREKTEEDSKSDEKSSDHVRELKEKLKKRRNPVIRSCPAPMPSPHPEKANEEEEEDTGLMPDATSDGGSSETEEPWSQKKKSPEGSRPPLNSMPKRCPRDGSLDEDEYLDSRSPDFQEKILRKIYEYLLNRGDEIAVEGLNDTFSNSHDGDLDAVTDIMRIIGKIKFKPRALDEFLPEIQRKAARIGFNRLMEQTKDPCMLSNKIIEQVHLREPEEIFEVSNNFTVSKDSANEISVEYNGRSVLLKDNPDVIKDFLEQKLQEAEHHIEFLNTLKNRP